MRKKYNTPKRNKYIRARLTESEKKDFDERLAVSNLSQTEYIRQAIFQSKINITIRIECSLEQMYELISQYGKIGSNLNQIAKYLNQGGYLSRELAVDIRHTITDLDDLKYKILEVVGKSYGHN